MSPMGKKMRFGAVLFAGLCSIVAAGQPALARHPAKHSPAVAAKSAPAFDQRVLDAEVLLDRAGFSPGAIDGRDGENFAKALHAFQEVNGRPVGRLDQQTAAQLAQLSNTPTLAQYTVQPEDVQGPFAPQIPRDFEQMAGLQRLAYHSPR